jgi:hypothetical protein
MGILFERPWRTMMCLSNTKFVFCALMSGYGGATIVLKCLQLLSFPDYEGDTNLSCTSGSGRYWTAGISLPFLSVKVYKSYPRHKNIYLWSSAFYALLEKWQSCDGVIRCWRNWASSWTEMNGHGTTWILFVGRLVRYLGQWLRTRYFYGLCKES